MSLTVTQRPSITYESETSRWNALKNPVLYKMQRNDDSFELDTITVGPGIVVTFLGIDLTSNFEIGDTVRVNSPPLYNNVLGTVLSTSFITNTTLTLDITYAGNSAGGDVFTLAERPNYRVEVEVYNGDNELLNETPFYYSQNLSGLVTIDVSKILKAYVLPDITLDLTASTQVFDDTNFLEFYIKYRERWTGSAEAQTNDTANRFYAVLAGMQIPSPTGGNMGPYAIPQAGFLTKLDTFVMWPGYPSLLSLIVNEDVASDVFLDTGEDTSTPSDQSGKLTVFDLNQIIIDQTIEETTATVLESTSAGGAVSDVIDVVINHEGCENPVMLIARNSLGGFIQWLFDVNQEVSYEVDDTGKFKKQRLFADNLTLNQWEALQDFITPGEVYKDNIVELTSSTIKTHTRVGNQVYVLNQDGTKVGVIVTSRARGTETRQKTHNFEIDIEYPELFI